MATTQLTVQFVSLPVAPITCQQHFSRRALGYLWSRRAELDPGQVKILDALYKGRKLGNIEGLFKVQYSLINSHAGKKGYGRMYGTEGSLETLERECRGTMCRDYYDDIDVVNCHPVLLYQFALRVYNVELKEVKKYCDNRPKYLERIDKNKDAAKQAILKVLYNGENKYKFLEPMVKEIHAFTMKYVLKDPLYQDLADCVRRQIDESEKKNDNFEGSFLSHILQTEERKVMLVMYESFIRQGFHVDVLAYDGVMIRKDEKNKLREENLRITEKDILQTTQYAINLINKPFEFFTIPSDADTEEVAPKVLRVDYEKKKAAFEDTSFYYNPTNMIITWDGSQMVQCTPFQAVTRFVNLDFRHSSNLMDSTSFIRLWLHDPSRRSVRSIDMKPSDDPMVFSPPLIFRYQTFEKSENARAIELFQKLLSVVCNHHEESLVYVRSWFAHILQKPFENPKTAIFITGRKGCGKDTLGDIMIEWVIGRNYSHNYQKTEQFWEKHDTSRENKLFVKMEEVKGALNRENANAFKSLITSDTMTVNPKGVAPRTSMNYCRYYGTANEPQPWKTEGDERRGFTIPCSTEWMRKEEIWKEIREVLFCEEGASSVGNWLYGLDITSWNPRKIPDTEYMRHSAAAEETSEENFLKAWDGAECSAVDLYNLYVAHCQANSLPYANNAKAFGMRILEHVRDGVIQRRRVRDGTVYAKP